MSKFLKFPNGTSCRPYMIGGVNVTDTGVAVNSSNLQLIAFIPVADDALKFEIKELIEDCADAGKKFVQPDWIALEKRYIDAGSST